MTCPPQHGKSTLISKFGAAWYVGTHPDEWVGVASYGAEFAAEWGRGARDVMEEYGPAVFGIQLREDAQAANRWLVAGHAGGMMTTGIGGTLTGRGLDFLIIDDPVENAEDALSERMRSKKWDWWLSTAKTRLHRDSSVVCLMTRWHEDDLGGRLIAREGFEEIRLPALADELPDPLGRQLGEALWPEAFPVELLEELKASEQGLYWFGAQYQGRPTAIKGGMFDRGKVTMVDASDVPADAARWRWWDLAATAERQGADPDWLVGLKMARAADGRVFVEDVRRRRVSALEVKDLLKLTANTDGKTVSVWVEQEGGASGKIVIADIVAMLAGWNVGGEPSTHDKVMRATPLAAQWQAGNVYVVRAVWNEAFFAEYESFPRGSHDDQVDAGSGAFSKLADDVVGQWFSSVSTMCPACRLPNPKGAKTCRWCTSPLERAS